MAIKASRSLAHSPEKRLIPSSINSYLKLYDRFAFFQPFFINRCHYKNRTLLWRKETFSSFDVDVVDAVLLP